MALSAAMIISGLPCEQFTDELQIIFNYGEVLLKTPIRSPSPRPVSSSSSSSSSGICVSSPSPDALLQRLDHYLDIISNLEHRFQVFQGTKEVGIKEVGTKEVGTKEVGTKEVGTKEVSTKEVDIKEAKSDGDKALKVMYQNRNILDMEEHLTSKWSFQHAVLEEEETPIFENNSQYSRINGASVRRHFMTECKEIDCGFNEPTYY